MTEKETKILKVEIHVAEPSDGDFYGGEWEVQKVILDGKEVTDIRETYCDANDWILYENEASSCVIAVSQVLTM